MKKIILSGAMLCALISKGQIDISNPFSPYKTAIEITSSSNKTCALSADSVVFSFPCYMERKDLHWFLDELIDDEIECHTRINEADDNQKLLRALIKIQDKLGRTYWEINKNTGIVRYGNKIAIKNKL